MHLNAASLRSSRALWRKSKYPLSAFASPLPAKALIILIVLAAIAFGWLIPFLEGVSYLIVPGMLTVVAIAVIAVRFERLPFYLLVASFPLLAWLSKNSDISYALLLVPGGLAILAWVQHLVLRRTTIVFDRSTTLALFFGIWTILSAINAGTITSTTYFTLRYWQAIVLLFLTLNLLREKQHLVELAWVLAISLGLFGAFVFLYQAQAYLQSGGFLTAVQIHLSIHQSADSNVTGMHIAMGVPFAFYLMRLEQLQRRRWRRYSLAILMLLMILGVLSTVSLGASFGLVTIIALLVLWTRNRSQRVLLTMLGLLLIAAALLSPMGERLTHQLSVVEEKDPMEWATGRGLSWYIGVKAIQQAPLFGLGPDRVGGVYELSALYMPFDLLKLRLESGRTPIIPHNIFLSVGGDLGVPGLLAFLALLASVMLPLWREIRFRWARLEDSQAFYMGLAVFIGLIAVLIQGMGIAAQTDRYLWILLGTGLAFTRISKRTKSESADGE